MRTQGTEVTVWVTRLQTETTRSRSFTTYKVQRLDVLDLRKVAELKQFLEWHRRIITWGLGVYVGSYLRDLENTMGAPGRESLPILTMTKEVTAPVQSMDFGESAEQEEIEQAETEQAETEQAETEQLPSALLGGSGAHGTFQSIPLHALLCHLITNQISTGSSAFHSVSTSSRTQSWIPIRRGSVLWTKLGAREI